MTPIIYVASDQLSQAEEIASKHTRTEAVKLSIHNTPDLSQLVSKHDLVIRYELVILLRWSSVTIY